MPNVKFCPSPSVKKTQQKTRPVNFDRVLRGRVLSSIGNLKYVFFVVWLGEQEKTIAWLREIDMREIQKQMMMNKGLTSDFFFRVINFYIFFAIEIFCYLATIFANPLGEILNPSNKRGRGSQILNPKSQINEGVVKFPDS